MANEWVEQEGSPDYVSGPGSTREYTRVFRAASGEGLTTAKAKKFIQGAHFVDHDGARLWLRKTHVAQHPAFDLVTLTWDNSDAGITSGGGYDSRFNDGVMRKAGDEEWSMQGSLESETVSENSRSLIDGDLFSNWGVSSGLVLNVDQMLIPGAVLTWKKWLNKVKTKGLNAPQPRQLPKTETDAIAMLETYLPGGSGTYETNAPKLGKRLGSSGTSASLLCVDINVAADGDLICRTAQYKYTNKSGGWPSPPYLS